MALTEGHSSEHWVDFNFFGHQLVIHYQQTSIKKTLHHTPVDGEEVPVPHFGIILDWETWHTMAARLTTKNIDFAIAPHIRFKGKIRRTSYTIFL